MVVNDGGYAPPPPSELVDNEYSVLDLTDLVMIDPVGTGFSKPLGDAKGEDFWGVDPDIESVGDFVRRYVTENGRGLAEVPARRELRRHPLGRARLGTCRAATA